MNLKVRQLHSSGSFSSLPYTFKSSTSHRLVQLFSLSNSVKTGSYATSCSESNELNKYRCFCCCYTIKISSEHTLKHEITFPQLRRCCHAENTGEFREIRFIEDLDMVFQQQITRNSNNNTYYPQKKAQMRIKILTTDLHDLGILMIAIQLRVMAFIENQKGNLHHLDEAVREIM